MWATILKLLASIAAYLSNKQLLDAGGAIERDRQNEALQEKKKIANAIDNSELDDDYLLPPSKRKRL